MNTNGCPNNPWGAPAGASDRDKDGIPDAIDACPDPPGVKTNNATTKRTANQPAAANVVLRYGEVHPQSTGPGTQTFTAYGYAIVPLSPVAASGERRGADSDHAHRLRAGGSVIDHPRHPATPFES